MKLHRFHTLTPSFSSGTSPRLCSAPPCTASNMLCCFMAPTDGRASFGRERPASETEYTHKAAPSMIGILPYALLGWRKRSWEIDALEISEDSACMRGFDRTTRLAVSPFDTRAFSWTLRNGMRERARANLPVGSPILACSGCKYHRANTRNHSGTCRFSKYGIRHVSCPIILLRLRQPRT